MNKTKELHEYFLKSTGVCIDTRKINTGVIFFALKGGNFDGNYFAKKAIELGALVAVVDNETCVGENIILVDNVLKSLQELASYHRLTFDIPLIALTGSNGKTTTKELLVKVLSEKYKVTSTVGNYNNHIGVPLTLLDLAQGSEIAVVEMGANHVGEIAFLCNIAKPTHGLITNIGKAHLEGFGGIEGVKKGKGELFDFLRMNDGVAFVNYTSDDLISLSDGIDKVIPYLDSNKVKNISTDKEENILIEDETEEVIHTNLVGDYNFANVIAAMRVGEYFGVNKSDVKKAIAEYIPNNNRSQVIETSNNKVLLDAYNANPTSIESALNSFFVGGIVNKVVILGDMFELGEYAQSEHLKIVELLSQLGFTEVILCGNDFDKVKDGFNNMHFFPTKKELEQYLETSPIKGKHVLVKGSRGIGLETILPFL